MTADLRPARHLVRGSDRHEWWRIALTGVGALLAAALAKGAVVPASVTASFRAAATAVPPLHRTPHPSELRYA
ncbi:hypothetical protein [Streptomyces sp. GESEQ-13]|uniref:hypothetical protein n=1 Tax=Streptomyces sp. GESEQ-13 TaxID=2812654 RepID=UPI001B33998B